MVTFSLHYARGAQREGVEAMPNVWVLMMEEISKKVVAEKMVTVINPGTWSKQSLVESENKR